MAPLSPLARGQTGGRRGGAIFPRSHGQPGGAGVQAQVSWSESLLSQTLCHRVCRSRSAVNSPWGCTGLRATEPGSEGLGSQGHPLPVGEDSGRQASPGGLRGPSTPFSWPPPHGGMMPATITPGVTSSHSDSQGQGGTCGRGEGNKPPFLCCSHFTARPLSRGPLSRRPSRVTSLRRAPGGVTG